MAFVRPAQDVINRNRSTSNVASSLLRYPSEATSHAMIFNFKNYSARPAGGTARASNGSIALPLPKTIQDVTSPDVMGRELGITGAAVVDVAAAMNSDQGLVGAATDSISKLTGGSVLDPRNVSASGLASFATFAARAGLTSIGGSEVEQGISVGTGTAVNPHQALVFNGIALKQYTFEWTLIPNNETESEQIRDIVKRFKSASLPSYGGVEGTQSNVLSRALLNYPNMVDVFFVGLDQNYFPLFKTAMISNVTVDYTPQGHVVVNKGPTGSRPAMVNLAVTIIESEIHTQEDYA
jgi:hypothetical protein